MASFTITTAVPLVSDAENTPLFDTVPAPDDTLKTYGGRPPDAMKGVAVLASKLTLEGLNVKGGVSGLLPLEPPPPHALRPKVIPISASADEIFLYFANSFSQAVFLWQCYRKRGSLLRIAEK
jgi:hypothetical protein